MKESRTLLAMFCLLAAMVSEAVAVDAGKMGTGENMAGYVTVFCKGGDAITMVACPFNNLQNPSGTGTWFSLDQLIGRHLGAGSDVASSDNVCLWNGNAYAVAFLNNGDRHDARIDWKWCFMDGGRPLPCAENPIFNITRGTGFLIRNRGADTNLVFGGELPMDDATGISITGMTMLVNPYPAEMSLDELVTAKDGAVASSDDRLADAIYVLTGTFYRQYFLNNGDRRDAEIDWKWCSMKSGKTVAANEMIRPGQGFWYRSRGTNFTWNARKPYSLP